METEDVQRTHCGHLGGFWKLFILCPFLTNRKRRKNNFSFTFSIWNQKVVFILEKHQRRVKLSRCSLQLLTAAAEEVTLWEIVIWITQRNKSTATGDDWACILNITLQLKPIPAGKSAILNKFLNFKGNITPSHSVFVLKMI